MSGQHVEQLRQLWTILANRSQVGSSLNPSEGSSVLDMTKTRSIVKAWLALDISGVIDPDQFTRAVDHWEGNSVTVAALLINSFPETL